MSGAGIAGRSSSVGGPCITVSRLHELSSDSEESGDDDGTKPRPAEEEDPGDEDGQVLAGNEGEIVFLGQAQDGADPDPEDELLVAEFQRTMTDSLQVRRCVGLLVACVTPM